MSRDINNPAFKKLLQKLQEESWQLELLISGFAIFGLFTATEPVEIIIKEAQTSDLMYRALIFTFLRLSIAILLINLLLHVILRGLWIGALGLRYVSGDIDYEALKYSPKFTNYLKNKIGSFDKYIATLENYCSVIFAISFLLIFYVLAFAFTMIAITAIAELLIDNESIPEWLRLGLGIPMMIFVLLGMLLTFVDFLTQGFLKRKKWISKIYFPIYWVFSFITLSFLYRPLVYNFLDNKFGKRISIFLVPIYVLLLLVTSIEDKKSNYFERSNDSNEYYASKRNYEDMLTEEGQFIKTAAIPSKVITTPYLKVFMAYSDRIEDRMFSRNEGLKPEKDRRGLSSDIVFTTSNADRAKRDSLRRAKDSLKIEYIKTFNSTYKVFIDSIQYPAEFTLAESATKEFGFESYVNIKGLAEGKHILRLKRDRFREKDTTEVSFATIPFWYFKE
ncbi:MAG: hypothetical protein QNJ57_05490 [Flavobacteriaceae bacterium]|nr:hypothetical protein [Flavobacteriaceae bacterium]